MKTPLLFIVITSLFLFFWSCKKDPKDHNNSNISPNIEEQNQRLSKAIPTVKTQVFLKVVIEDEDGKPLAGVQIQAGELTATTDENGVSVFDNININKDYALVTAYKTGYMKGSRTFAPTSGAFNTTSITLIKHPAPKEFNARAGSTIRWDNANVSIYFPPNAIVDAQGNPYGGLVQVFAKHLHPNHDQFNQLMPGTLVGLTENNTLSGMLSYGMIFVELHDAVGNPLQLGNGKTAKVTLPAVLDAPTIMPTWHFNEKHGLWVEAGRAQKVGNTYEFEANSFSAWNLDIFVDDGFDDIILEIMNENKLPIANQVIQVFAGPEFNHKSRLVHTDDKGKFRMVHVPKDLKLRFIGKCEDLDKHITLTTPTKQVEFNLSELKKGQFYNINGKMKNCINEVYKNSHFFLQSFGVSPSLQFVGKTDELGHYSTNAFICEIDPTITYKMIAQIYTENNKIRIDTLTLSLMGMSQRLDVNFCNAKEIEDVYPPGSVFCNGIPTFIEDVINPTTGKTWMDRNLGATRTATSSNDVEAYGDLYQWGRRPDGHQCRNSPTTPTLSSIDQPTHGSFITTNSLPLDWRSPQNTNLWQGVNGINNPCPNGYRLPTEAELITESSSWSSQNASGAFNSPLKLTAAGDRDLSNGTLTTVGERGSYWSSTINGDAVQYIFFFNPANLNYHTGYKSSGFSVRCIKD
jgi:uncharacterized protein (TIGR02145 family)